MAKADHPKDEDVCMLIIPGAGGAIPTKHHTYPQDNYSSD